VAARGAELVPAPLKYGPASGMNDERHGERPTAAAGGEGRGASCSEGASQAQQHQHAAHPHGASLAAESRRKLNLTLQLSWTAAEAHAAAAPAPARGHRRLDAPSAGAQRARRAQMTCGRGACGEARGGAHGNTPACRGLALPCCSCVRVPAEYGRHPGTSSEEHCRRPGAGVPGSRRHSQVQPRPAPRPAARLSARRRAAGRRVACRRGREMHEAAQLAAPRQPPPSGSVQPSSQHLCLKQAQSTSRGAAQRPLARIAAF
jgi:hypothetical protein